MIQLLILFFAVVFIIAIIMLYKKYIRIKNVVDEELDKKYNKVKKAIGSNNTQISQLKKNADELINTPSNNTNTLEDKVNNNKKQIAENRAVMVDKNFQEINKIFKYENGFVTGGNAGQLKIGSDNIQLNVPNPVQVRVCDEQSCDDSDIFTKSNVNDNLALVNDENVVDADKPENNDGVPSVDNDNIVYSVNANGEKDNNLEFNNDTNILTFYEPDFITVIEMEPAYHYREISIKVDDVPVDITISNEVDNTYYKNNNTNVLINKKFSESTLHSDWFSNNYERPLRIKLLNNDSNDLSNSTNKIELNYASKETKDATEISVNYELMTNELGKVTEILKII